MISLLVLRSWDGHYIAADFQHLMHHAYWAVLVLHLGMACRPLDMSTGRLLHYHIRFMTIQGYTGRNFLCVICRWDQAALLHTIFFVKMAWDDGIQEQG